MFKILKNNKGFLGISFGKKKGESKSESAKPIFVQQPDYAESEGARKSWWEQLQQFSGQPGYGAIAPDWADIWETAQRKVRQYFWGSPMDPGLVGKVKASSARRGVSESPANEMAIARMGATEGNIYSDMATQEAQSKAEFAESGRQNYLDQLGRLAGLKTQGAWWTPWTKGKTSGTNWGVEANTDDLKKLLTSAGGSPTP